MVGRAAAILLCFICPLDEYNHDINTSYFVVVFAER